MQFRSDDRVQHKRSESLHCGRIEFYMFLFQFLNNFSCHEWKADIWFYNKEVKCSMAKRTYTTTGCGVNYQLLAVMLMPHWATPSHSRPQPAHHNGVRVGIYTIEWPSPSPFKGQYHLRPSCIVQSSLYKCDCTAEWIEGSALPMRLFRVYLKLIVPAYSTT